MTDKERHDRCVTLASILMDTVCEDLGSASGNQMRFLSVNAKTNQTVVAVVAVGTAAEMMLDHLDRMRQAGRIRVASEDGL